MIKLQNVTKQFEGAVTAVDAISFVVREGETFGLIGTSGCGKTTTLKMINRLIEPTSGSILIDGKSILDRPPEVLRRSIGYVIQNVGLFPHYSVQENIAITPKLLNWEINRIEQRSRELLQMVGMDEEHHAHRKPDELSGGQQQRVGLARALAADPPVLLMDEPFGALDPITKEQVRQEFKKLLQQINKTIVLVTHDVFEAFDLCDRIGLMDEGAMQQIGTPRELLFQPTGEFVESFFENHRFQLEMMSVFVCDIVKAIKNDTGKEESPPFAEGIPLEKEEQARSTKPWRSRGDDRTISLSDSFFSVFEDTLPGDSGYVVLNNESEPVATITPDELLKGFQQVRRTLKEGRDD